VTVGELDGEARSVKPHARAAASTTYSHAVVAVVGAVVLVWTAWPLTYDGLLSTDRFAVVFLALCGSVLAIVGGFVEGLLERPGWGIAARIALAAFAVVAIYPPLLMTARWFESKADDAKSSSTFGLALVMWLLTVGGQYAVAQAVRGRAAGVRSS
jgi:hypothetical protein